MKQLFSATFLKYLLTQKRRVLICVAIFISQATVTAILPLPMSFAIDHVLTPKPGKPASAYLQPILDRVGPQQSLILVVAAMAGVYLLAILLDLLEAYFVTMASNRLSEGLKKEMFRKVIRSRKSYIDQSDSADIIGRLSQDSLNIQVLFQTGLPVLVRSIPSLLMIIGILYTVNVYLALGMTLVAGLMFFNAYYFTELARTRRREVRVEMTNYEQTGYQALGNFMLVKLLHRQRQVSKQMARIARKVSNTLFMANLFETLMMTGMDTIKNTLRVLTLLIGGYAVLRGNFTVGGIMMITSYINSIAASMSDLTKFSYKSARSVASLDRIDDLLKKAGDQGDPDGPVPLVRRNPVSLRFEDVSFSYPGSASSLAGFSLDLRGGQVVAVVGPSGVGKSTMLNLISRIVRADSGKIQINGQNVELLHGRDLHAFVSYVPQRLFFMKDTIAENLKMSITGNVSEDRIWRAIKRVNADAFVRELDGGIETVIGDCGKVISGGQSRRLALARGFLREPDGIFLFDEPTDSLDPASRAEVLGAIQSLGREGGLVIYTTHRQDELAIADTVIKFHGGGKITVTENSANSAPPALNSLA